eukprot:GHVS01053410.1.p1 GENE.GHVS01053410.1~~GHVS01053410.1.p1  ORF type:complete len:278 (+),score=34.60 GHVS01053410.1:378-1211(+)
MAGTNLSDTLSTEQIPTMKGEDERRSFDNIINLGIENNNINEWSTVGKLCLTFPFLQQLRWHGNPLSPSLADLQISNKKSGRQAICYFNRQMLIALLPQLTTLNGGPVVGVERTNGERYFLSLAAQYHPVVLSLLQLKNVIEAGIDMADKSTSQIVEHPIIQRLARKHGSISPTAPTAVAPLTLQSSLIEITLKPDCSSGCSRGAVVKKLPSTMTVKDLRLLCSRLFGVPPPRVALRMSEKGRLISVELSEEDHQLNLYGVSSGCSVYVQDSVGGVL